MCLPTASSLPKGLPQPSRFLLGGDADPPVSVPVGPIYRFQMMAAGKSETCEV